MSVELVVSDGLLRSATARADATVVNSAPTVSVTLSDASPSKRDVLTATATARDADGDTLWFTYTWRVDGKVKQITTATTASTSTLDLRAVEAEVGDTISVNVVVSDGALSAAASASAKVTPAGR